jgi:hypothetical protein
MVNGCKICKLGQKIPYIGDGGQLQPDDTNDLHSVIGSSHQTEVHMTYTKVKEHILVYRLTKMKTL